MDNEVKMFRFVGNGELKQLHTHTELFYMCVVTCNCFNSPFPTKRNIIRISLHIFLLLNVADDFSFCNCTYRPPPQRMLNSIFLSLGRNDVYFAWSLTKDVACGGGGVNHTLQTEISPRPPRLMFSY